MLEQVSGLSVNLELILVAEEIGIKALLRHFRHCNTNDYAIESPIAVVPIEAYGRRRLSSRNGRVGALSTPACL
jgi:hypothetical protein